MSKATSQAFSSYRRNRTVLSFRERYRLTVFVSNGTVAVMAQRGVSLKSVLTCYEKNKMIFFFIWAVIDFLTINISWFLLNIKQHPSPISRKPQTVLNVWMAWIVCIVLFSYHKCACPMSRAIAATFWPRGRRALRARRPRGPNVKKKKKKIIGSKLSNIQSVPTFISTTIMATDGHVGRDGLFEKLKELGIETSTVEHPEVKHTSNTFVKFNRKIVGFCVKLLL